MRILLYVGGGFAAGVVIGKLMLDGGHIRPNASKKRGPKKPKGASVEQQVRSLPTFGPDEPLSRLKVAIPEYAEDASLWSTSKGGRFAVVRDNELVIGFVERQGDKFKGITLVGEYSVPVISKTTRKDAIGAVYAADLLLEYLQVRRGYIDNTKDIAERLGIPENMIAGAGESLAEAGVIYGVTGRVRVEPTMRQEKVIIPGMPPVSSDPALKRKQQREKERAKRRRRRGSPTKIEHKRRRVVDQPDVGKLRRSRVLTPQEKKALPKAKVVQRHAFGMAGPHGVRGMYGFGLESPEQGWTDEERKRFEQRLEQQALEQKAAEEAERTLLAEKAAETAVLGTGRPYYTSLEETIRKLIMDPEEAPSDTFFEDKRLEGLDWMSRQRDQQYKARKVDAAMKLVEQLRKKLAKATERTEAAKAAGKLTPSIVGEQMVIRSKLDEALERLAKAQKALHEE